MISYESEVESLGRRIYLDFNASTPIAPEAVEAIRPFLTDHYGNHRASTGRVCRRRVQLRRPGDRWRVSWDATRHTWYLQAGAGNRSTTQLTCPPQIGPRCGNAFQTDEDPSVLRHFPRLKSCLFDSLGWIKRRDHRLRPYFFQSKMV